MIDFFRFDPHLSSPIHTISILTLKPRGFFLFAEHIRGAVLSLCEPAWLQRHMLGGGVVSGEFAEVRGRMGEKWIRFCDYR